MNEKLVSVVMPAYNAELYIAEAIESILAQTFNSFEIIVVDDGSTDRTAFIARQFEKDICYIYQSNRGLAAARNTGIRNSQGKIIALLDADDLWESRFLEVMFNLLCQNPDAAATYCGFQYIDEQGFNVGKPSLKVVPPDQFHETLVTHGNWLSACGVIFYRAKAEELGFFDESLRAVEDEDLWIRMSAQWPFVGTPEALVKYRRHDSNMSKDPERMVTAILKSREKIFGSPDSDVKTWPVTKITAYRNTYQLAAIRYLASGDIQKSAEFIQKLAGIAKDDIFSMQLWRGLARAHIPEVHQFDSNSQPDWKLSQAQVIAVLDELAKRIPNSIVLQNQCSRVKSSAFVAMADESGRGRKLLQALTWLLKAIIIKPQNFFTRPFWGTVARSFLYKLHSSL